MSIPLRNLEVGKCYVTGRGQVLRVVGLLPGRVQFERRISNAKGRRWGWVNEVAGVRAFTSMIERKVPYNWTPERKG